MYEELLGLSDGGLAHVLAEQAGRHLMALRIARLANSQSLDAASTKALGDDADRTSNDLIVGALAALRPDDSILSEESADDLSRLQADRVWIVDPLDGTREYKTPGNTDWTVHIALWQRDKIERESAKAATAKSQSGKLILGVVGLPPFATVMRSDQLLHHAEGPSPSDDARFRSGVSERGLRIVRSGSREQPHAERVAAALGAELISMGSAGAKAMAVVRGDADAYVHSGGQWEWDSAAPVAVAVAHGLFAARLDGSQMLYNQPDTYLADFVICRADLADRIVSVLNPR